MDFVSFVRAAGISRSSHSKTNDDLFIGKRPVAIRNIFEMNQLD
jgi:hypothetical protein